ncbi:MAG: hypothetical protein K2N67_08580, partial [Mucispirillum sp.]|nr:hypothetical protein [Mucispirillum sp.]
MKAANIAEKDNEYTARRIAEPRLKGNDRARPHKAAIRTNKENNTSSRIERNRVWSIGKYILWMIMKTD